MKRVIVHLTTAETLVVVLALDAYIAQKGNLPHVVADSARSSMETALIGEPWPSELDAAVSLTENQVAARAEYNALPDEAKVAVDERWAKVPEWQKDELRNDAELDLL